jgi:hypothetical protein
MYCLDRTNDASETFINGADETDVVQFLLAFFGLILVCEVWPSMLLCVTFTSNACFTAVTDPDNAYVAGIIDTGEAPEFSNNSPDIQKK